MTETGNSPEQAETISHPQALPDTELQAVSLAAAMRRRQQEFKLSLLALQQPSGSAGRRAAWEKTRLIVNEETSGATTVEPDQAVADFTAKEAEYVSRIISTHETVPLEAAYAYAQLAKLAQLAGQEYQEYLDRARQLVANAQTTPKLTPANLLPDAIILGVEARQLQTLPQPTPEAIATGISNDPQLLVEYALVASEAERARFIAALPAEQQREASVLMDRTLSPFLRAKTLTDADVPTRDAVMVRASQELSNAIRFDKDIDSPTLVKALSETLGQLDNDDSKRLLQEVGTRALAGESDPQQHRRKIVYAGRIVQTLADIDQAKGDNLTMKFLGKREVPTHLFRYFSTRLMESEFLTRNLERYLGDDRNLPFLRKLVAENFNEFNTVVDTLSQIPTYEPHEHTDEIFRAIHDLDSLTPTIFNRYRQADDRGKQELAQQIRELKPKFFQNQPIKNILPKADREILAEMVYLAYRPVGMDFQRVKGLIETVDDRTGDLAPYQFPAEGFDFSLRAQKAFGLKTGERIDQTRLSGYRELLTNPTVQTDESIKKVSLVLNALSKGRSALTGTEIATVFGVFSQDELVQNFLGRYPRVESANAYNYIAELKEILGIYFKDNFEQSLATFLTTNTKTCEELAKIWTNPKRLEALRKQLGSQGTDIDWTMMKSAGTQAKILARFLNAKVLPPYREELGRNLKKFEERDTGEVAEWGKTNLKAHLSKNIGSFFAKASAGICTAADIPLFNRKDHFHMNIVEGDEKVRANIQAYVVNVENHPSLVLRGFNPNVDFLEKIDVAAFCEKVMDIGRQFVSENKLSGLYITMDDDWHALTNREKVRSYLTKKYCRPDAAVSYHLSIASAAAIDTIYRIPDPIEKPGDGAPSVPLRD